MLLPHRPITQATVTTHTFSPIAHTTIPFLSHCPIAETTDGPTATKQVGPSEAPVTPTQCVAVPAVQCLLCVTLPVTHCDALCC